MKIANASECRICPTGTTCGDFPVAACSLSRAANCNVPGGGCACRCACSAPDAMQIPTFVRIWRAFAESLPETAEQAAKLLPGVAFSDAPGFVAGYKRGVRAYCHQIERSGIITLDASASIDTPAGYLTGIQRGAHDATIAFGQLLGIELQP